VYYNVESFGRPPMLGATYGAYHNTATDFPVSAPLMDSPMVDAASSPPVPTLTPSTLSTPIPVSAPAPGYVPESWDPWNHWAADGTFAHTTQSDLEIKKTLLAQLRNEQGRARQDVVRPTATQRFPWLLVGGVAALAFFAGRRKK